MNKIFKAVLKCLLTGKKFLKHFWSLFFDNCAFNWWCYWNKNASNDIFFFFFFSVSVMEFESQPTGFLAHHFFIIFIQKLTQMLTLTLFSQIVGSLTTTEKKMEIKDTRCSIFHYKSKNTYKFDVCEFPVAKYN